jgi:hypothetical protein
LTPPCKLHKIYISTWLSENASVPSSFHCRFLLFRHIQARPCMSLPGLSSILASLETTSRPSSICPPSPTPTANPVPKHFETIKSFTYSDAVHCSSRVFHRGNTLHQQQTCFAHLRHPVHNVLQSDRQREREREREREKESGEDQS